MTSDFFQPFLTYLVSTMFDNFYPIMSNIWDLFWTPLPTLKSDIIYGRSRRDHLNVQFGQTVPNGIPARNLVSSTSSSRIAKNTTYQYTLLQLSCRHYDFLREFLMEKKPDEWSWISMRSNAAASICSFEFRVDFFYRKNLMLAKFYKVKQIS